MKVKLNSFLGVSRWILVILFTSSSFRLSAQTIERSVFGTLGSSSTSGPIQLESTLGEMAIASYLVDSIQITEGFHQNKISIVTGVLENRPKTFEANLSVFPNPTSGAITVYFEEASKPQSSLDLFDLQGRLLRSWNLELMDREFPIDISQYPTSSYILQYNEKGIPTQQFKIIKH